MDAMPMSEYAASLFGAEDQELSQMREEAEREGLPTIQVSPELAQFLAWLVPAVGARTILEVGALFGYSAAIMARSLPADGKLLSLEAEPRHATIATANLRRLGLGDRVEVRLGKGLDSLRSLDSTFDIVFIDANKDQYVDYLEEALRLTHRGSIIVADNVWRGGSVTSGEDTEARGVGAYNRRVAENPNLRSFMLPHRDGRDAAAVSVVIS